MPNLRDRPPGLAPKGSSAALGIVMLYWNLLPALTCFALIPFGRDVFDWAAPMLLCPVLALLVMIPMSVGFRWRRYWGVVMFYWAAILSLGFLGVLLLVVAVALVKSRPAPPPLIGLTWIAGAIGLLLALLLPFVLRALRLRYWQPGAAPSEWEIGDEHINPRVVRALGGRR
jgi:hypothetical protein